MYEVIRRRKGGRACGVATTESARKKHRVLGGRSPEFQSRLLLAVFVTGEWRNTG